MPNNADVSGQDRKDARRKKEDAEAMKWEMESYAMKKKEEEDAKILAEALEGSKADRASVKRRRRKQGRGAANKKKATADHGGCLEHVLLQLDIHFFHS